MSKVQSLMSAITNNEKNNSTVAIRVACAIAFLFFTFSYLYFYQCDLVGAQQHVLSQGQTSYSRFIGAVIITAILYLVHLGVYGITKLNKQTHALTYFPSLLLLCLLTSTKNNFDQHFSLTTWTWFIPVLLIIYAVIVYSSMQWQPYESEKWGTGLLSKWSWVNMLTMALMFIFVGMLSNGNDVLHYRLHIERCLKNKDYAGALAVGERSLETDSSLVMLRASALARAKQLPERLFEYPLVGGSASLFPNGNSVRCVSHDPGDIYRPVGAIPKDKMTVGDYLKTIKITRQTHAAYGDYVLCAYLLDKKLDKFASELRQYYKVDSITVLPKHYREALTLYNHQHAVKYQGFVDEVGEADYEDLQAMRKKYHNPQECQNRLRDAYGKTYWYYYLY